MIQHAMKLKKVTPAEVYDAFWKAYNDPYTSADGIEWKHLWKYISQERGDERKFTYREMENYCIEKGISTDFFTHVRDEEGKIKFWRLKNG